MGRSFYVFKDKKTGTYRAEILEPATGERICYRSTGLKTRDEAVMLVSGWLRDGMPRRERGRAPVYRRPETKALKAINSLAGILEAVKGTELGAGDAAEIARALKGRGLLEGYTDQAEPGGIDLISYLREFWDYDKSPYVRYQKAHNHSIGRRYCYEAGKRVDQYWKEWFQGFKLEGIARKDIKDFSLILAELGFSAGYTNMILNSGAIPLAYAAREEIIPKNPVDNLERFTDDSPGRGCLTPEEAELVFSSPWPDKRAYAGNMLAMTSGLRHGEIIALTRADIDPEKPILHIRHSWSGKDDLKCPKNGEARKDLPEEEIV